MFAYTCFCANHTDRYTAEIVCYVGVALPMEKEEERVRVGGMFCIV